MTDRPLILLTNDDGPHSAGTLELFKKLHEWADVVCIVPDQDRSQCSHATIATAETSARHWFRVSSGMPVDCVRAGLSQLPHQPGTSESVWVQHRQPDMVISGINDGYNTGKSVWVSGTIAAAREGALHGIPSIAFSADTGLSGEKLETLACIASDIAERVANSTVNELLLNVNLVGSKRVLASAMADDYASDYAQIRLGNTTMTRLRLDQGLFDKRLYALET